MTVNLHCSDESTQSSLKTTLRVDPHEITFRNLELYFDIGNQMSLRVEFANIEELDSLLEILTFAKEG